MPLKKKEIISQLKKEILTLELKPGTIISETTLVERFQLSRTPIRDILKLLSLEAYINIYPKKGSVVSYIDLESVQQIIYLRSTLEKEVMKELAANISLKGLHELNNLLSKQKEAIESENKKENEREDENKNKNIKEDENKNKNIKEDENKNKNIKEDENKNKNIKEDENKNKNKSKSKKEECDDSSITSSEAFLNLDDAFHKALFVLSGREFLWSIIQQFNVHYLRYRRLHMLKKDKCIELHKEHELILHYIVNKEIEKIDLLVDNHMRADINSVYLREHFGEYISKGD